MGHLKEAFKKNKDVLIDNMLSQFFRYSVCKLPKLLVFGGLGLYHSDGQVSKYVTLAPNIHNLTFFVLLKKCCFFKGGENQVQAGEE